MWELKNEKRSCCYFVPFVITALFSTMRNGTYEQENLMPTNFHT